MANTLAALRTTLRNLLLDTAGLPTWSDAALNQALGEAVAEHSFLFPLRVRQLYTVSLGAQAIPLFAVDSLTPSAGPLGYFGPTSVSNAADIIAVQRVELPVGTPIIPDPRQITDPAGSASNPTAYAQAWTYVGGFLWLRNPAAALEVGANTLQVELLQTYSLPDVGNTIAWNGPVHDLALLFLLAQREALQQYAGWGVRDGRGGTPLPQGPGPNVPLVLASLEITIARAIKARQGRGMRSRTLDT